MVSSVSTYLQSRSVHYLFQFKIRDNQHLVLRIYDIVGPHIFKKSFPPSDPDYSKFSHLLASGKFSPILDCLIQRNLIPQDCVPPQNPQIKECEEDLEKIIKKAKSTITIDNKYTRDFTCPISLEVFTEPVIDEHGHTFEQRCLEEHLRIKNECPINRQPLTQPCTPNRQIKQAIETWQKQDPIPTFSNFKKQIPSIAAKHIELAQDYMKEKEYEHAIESYNNAFLHTKDWKDYTAIPLLFKEMGEKEKAILAYLYLALYQLKDKKIPEAIETLKDALALNPLLGQVAILVVKLHIAINQTKDATKLALQYSQRLTDTSVEETISLYRQIIMYDPGQLDVYFHLSDLLTDPAERAHILLKGATHALEKEAYDVVEGCCEKAEQLFAGRFIDRLTHLSLLKMQKKDRQIKEKLLLIAHQFEKNRLVSQAVKAYVMLADLEYQPSYYRAIIQGYQENQQFSKAYEWTKKWLSILIEKNEWEAAEHLVLQSLEMPSCNKIFFYEQLEIIYTHWQKEKLNTLYVLLAKAYEENRQMGQAEVVYRKAFDLFHSLEYAIFLADILKKQDKILESTQTYYEAATIALLSDQTDRLKFCVQSMHQIDPALQHLDPTQRMHILTQWQLYKQRIEFENALNDLKSKTESKMAEQMQFLVTVADANGLVNLAICYATGTQGFTKDEQEAIKWLHKAADKGHPHAKLFIDPENRLREEVVKMFVDGETKLINDLKAFDASIDFPNGVIIMDFAKQFGYKALQNACEDFFSLGLRQAVGNLEDFKTKINILISRFGGITNLNLSNCKLQTEHWQAIGLLSSIKSLNLQSCGKITREAIVTLSKLRPNSLNLSHCDFPSFDSVFNCLSSMPLCSLNLNQCYIDPSFDFTAFICFQKLSFLKVSSNHVIPQKTIDLLKQRIASVEISKYNDVPYNLLPPNLRE